MVSDDPSRTGPTLRGVVLAGGRSSRFGSPKSEALLDGKALMAWVLEALDVLEPPHLIIGDPGGVRPAGIEVRPDDQPGFGPMGGILTALRHCGREWCLVVACDLPLVSREVLLTLVQHIRVSTGDAVVPVTVRGPEPLMAGYSRRCMADLEERISAGELKMVDFLKRVKVDCLPVDDLGDSPEVRRSFLNVNTREDLKSAEDLLRGAS